MNWQGCERNSTVYTTILAVALRDLEEIRKVLVRLINAPAEVQN